MRSDKIKIIIHDEEEQDTKRGLSISEAFALARKNARDFGVSLSKEVDRDARGEAVWEMDPDE